MAEKSRGEQHPLSKETNAHARQRVDEAISNDGWCARESRFPARGPATERVGNTYIRTIASFFGGCDRACTRAFTSFSPLPVCLVSHLQNARTTKGHFPIRPKGNRRGTNEHMMPTGDHRPFTLDTLSLSPSRVFHAVLVPKPRDAGGAQPRNKTKKRNKNKAGRQDTRNEHRLSPTRRCLCLKRLELRPPPPRHALDYRSNKTRPRPGSLSSTPTPKNRSPWRPQTAAAVVKAAGIGVCRAALRLKGYRALLEAAISHPSATPHPKKKQCDAELHTRRTHSTIPRHILHVLGQSQHPDSWGRLRERSKQTSGGRQRRRFLPRPPCTKWSEELKQHLE